MFEVNQIIVENSTRLKYTVLHRNIDNITVVAHYVNAIPFTIHVTYAKENYEIVEITEEGK